MLQFITHHTDRYDEIAGTRAVLEGGCRWVQLRMKDTPAEEVLRIGREIEKLCREYGAKFILDDHVELVRELNADGVHLGKLDMPVAEARRLLGPEYLIGATANTFEDIERGAGQGADYIGLGLDATVAEGGPEFEFRNNTNYPIKVCAEYTTSGNKNYLKIFVALSDNAPDALIKIFFNLINRHYHADKSILHIYLSFVQCYQSAFLSLAFLIPRIIKL